MNQENTGLSLLEKGKRSILSMVFSRLGLILLLLLFQIALIIGIFCWFEEFIPHIYGIAMVFSVAMVLYL